MASQAEKLEPVFVGLGAGEEFAAAVRDGAAVLAPDDVGQLLQAAAAVLQDIDAGLPAAMDRMDKLLLDHRQGPVFQDVEAVVFVLLVGDLEDHHPAFRVHIEALVAEMRVGLGQSQGQRDEGGLFHQGMLLLFQAGEAGDGAVGGAQDLDEILLLQAAELAGEQGGGGAPFGGDGKAVLLHEELVDELPFPLVSGAVLVFKFSQPAAQGF